MLQRFLVAFLCLLPSFGSHAATVAEMGAGNLFSGADAIILGQATTQSSYADQAGIWTATTIRVADVWKGPHLTEYVLRQYGGAVGDQGLAVPGIVPLRTGEQYLLVLDPGHLLSPVRGLSQGLFQVRGDTLSDGFGRQVYWLGDNVPLLRKTPGGRDDSEVVPLTSTAAAIPETLSSLRLHVDRNLRPDKSEPSSSLSSLPTATYDGLPFGDFTIIECVPNSGNPLKGWRDKELRLTVLPSIADNGPGHRWLDAFGKAVTGWVAGTDTVRVYFGLGTNGSNVVSFSETVLADTPWPDGLLGITYVYYNVPDCYITETDILLNPGVPLFTNEPNQPSNFQAFDFQSLVGHEIGHALGLDHPDRLTNAAIMFSRLSLGNRVSVSFSDAHGRDFLYGAAHFAPVPVISSNGVVNGASFTGPALAPGEIATIFGTRLSNVSGVIQATEVPLPKSMFVTSVTVGNSQAPLLALANINGLEQINFQVPWEVTGTQTSVGVGIHPQLGAVVSVPLVRAHPGIFTLDGILGMVLHNGSGLAVTPQNPAVRGELVSIYATGLGRVTNPPPSGSAALAFPLSITLETPNVTIGGRFTAVQFSGLAPGFVGLYQVNAQVPFDVPSGMVDVAIQMTGQISKSVKLAIQ